MKPHANISVVIPVWNGRADLERLLNSLARQTFRPAETLVVDNGSTDGAGELAATCGARIIRFQENRGFAAAVNCGVAETSEELVAILNSDVELDPDWSEKLGAALQHPDVWFATGLIVSADDPNRIDGAWDLISRAAMPWRAGSGFAIAPPFVADRPIDCASFTAILLKRLLWNKVGPLDERFESYLEDVDFGIRCARASCGGRFVTAARARHRGSATLGRWHKASVQRMSRNQIFLARKYLDRHTNQWTLLIGQLLWGVVAFRHGAGVAWFCGKWDGWKRRREFLFAGPSAQLLFAAHEEQIIALQRQANPDWYWKWYAALTGPLRRIDTGGGNG